MAEFFTPPDHIHFLAKHLFGSVGEVIDGSIAYLEKNGGGPTEQHTHEHNHLFIVVQGEARIYLADEQIILKENDSYIVDGHIPHSIWNNVERTTIMIGLSIK